MEILKNAKKGEFGLVFRRFAFVSLVGPSVNVEGRSVVNSCEDLEGIHCQGVEIWEKPKKNTIFGAIFVVLGSFDLCGLLGTWEGVMEVMRVSIWLRFGDWG